MAESNSNLHLSIVTVVGAKNSGKTTFLEFLLNRARNMNLSIGGFLSRGNIVNHQKREYFLEDLTSGERHLLASTTPHPSRKIRYGSYYFNPDVFKLGQRLLLRNMDSDLLVMDEFGPLELRGEGFRESFNLVLKEYHGIFLVAVRPSLLSDIKSIFKSGKRISVLPKF